MLFVHVALGFLSIGSNSYSPTARTAMSLMAEPEQMPVLRRPPPLDADPEDAKLISESQKRRLKPVHSEYPPRE